jgi:hypothetical protein
MVAMPSVLLLSRPTLGLMSAEQATDWPHYVHKHHCHVTEHEDSHVQGQNRWLCNDGELH